MEAELGTYRQSTGGADTSRKECRVCLGLKELKEFGINNRAKDGKQNLCKECDAEKAKKYRSDKYELLAAKRRDYRSANPDKVRASKAKYYESNKEAVRAKVAEWRGLNPEKVKEASKRQWAASKEHMSANNLKWRQLNVDRIRRTNKLWRDLNADRRKELEHNRRAEKRINGGKLSKGITQKLMELQKGLCACCGVPLTNGYHLDHIIPISKGGRNDDNNVQLLTPKCNMSKGDKDYKEWMATNRRMYAGKEI